MGIRKTSRVIYIEASKAEWFRFVALKRGGVTDFGVHPPTNCYPQRPLPGAMLITLVIRTM